jgi:hypothetical protein
MNQRIIYKVDDSVTIIIPTPEALQTYTIQQIAEKDVPEGVSYKIVDVSEIPSDRTFRDAWDIDEAELTDGVGGSITSFDEV